MSRRAAETQRTEPLGAILAGGESRRFGAPKAFATVGRRRAIDRVAAALGEVTGHIVLIANDFERFGGLGWEVRGDAVAGAGPVAGIEAALRWAREEGYAGALVCACDLPFVSPALLRALADAGRQGDALAVVPESTGRRGMEPLCAWYSVDALGAAEAALRSGGGAVWALLDAIPVRRLPIDAVRRFGDPEILFLNLNTPQDLERARQIEPGDDDDE